MTPAFNGVNRRLVMRYANPEHRTFTFANLVTSAIPDEMYNLASAFASIQAAQPSRVTTVLTRQLIF